MELKFIPKLTENKSNQINICNSLDSISSRRENRKIKSKQKSLLTEDENKINPIKGDKLIDYMKFPKIKRIAISNNKKIEDNININSSFMNNIKIIKKSNSNRRNIIKKTDYININSLFSYPKFVIKRNNPNKINYYNSIDVPNRQRVLKNPKLKNLPFNIPINNSSKMFPLKPKNNKKKDELYEIRNFMKMKYYEDTKKKLEKKLKDDSFFDKKVKDKIIQIGKFQIFWKNVLDYCGSLAFSERMKNNRKSSKQNMVEETECKIKLKKLPKNRLYTSMLKSKLIHFKNNI